MYVALFSRTKSTLLQAITNGHLLTWPDMTTTNVRKYIPNTAATALGYLDQE